MTDDRNQESEPTPGTSLVREVPGFPIGFLLILSGGEAAAV
jgi:hypothetical protein